MQSTLSNKLKAMIQLMRPKQWIKNAFVLAALMFSVKFTDPIALWLSLLGVLCFCMVSSLIYILNDVIDCEKDRHHPKKKHRPIAAGVITKGEAYVLMALLVPLSLYLAYRLGTPMMMVIGLYILNNIAYSFYVKHVVILDVMSIAAGFLLRVIAGGVIIQVFISPWILFCTLLLSLFLGFSKRRHEITSLEGGGQQHRKILEEYSPAFIDQMLAIITAAIVMSYSMYTFFKGYYLMLTIPFVLYGIFRYQYLIYQRMEGGSPEETVLSDKPLLLDILLWVLASMAILFYVK